MLAGLFYSRINKKDDSGKSSQVLEAHLMSDKSNDLPISNSSSAGAATHKAIPSLDETNLAPQYEGASSDKFISSADVFRIQEYRLTENSTGSKKVRSGGHWHWKDSASKPRAIVLGYFVRKRMKSHIGRKLKGLIVDGQHKSEKRSYWVKLLIEFAQSGVFPVYCDDNLVPNSPNSHEFASIKKDISTKESRGASRKHSSSTIVINSCSSVKAQMTSNRVISSLRGALGLQDMSLGILLNDATPDFLAEKRRIFLQTIFSLEEHDYIFSQVPRMVTGNDSPLDINGSLKEICGGGGGGYHEIIGRIKGVCNDI